MNNSFRRNDPLTMRTARTLREIDDDPRDWWEGHDPEFTPPAGKSWRVPALIAGVLLAGLAFGALWGRA